ncbi:MAG: UvrB/UvrC motif-containing protein [Phycisphaerae bacterium]
MAADGAGATMSETIETFDGEVSGTPPLSDEILSDVPPRRGVALLAAADGSAIQLLTAADMRARVRNRIHAPDEQTRRNMPDLGKVTSRVAWKLASGHFETDLYFFELARRYWPDEYPGMLAFKPAWFVHVDPEAEVPRFERTRRPEETHGRRFGPFPSGKSAQRFCDIIRDGFYLCRDVRMLRKAPQGQPCAYGQMDRCLGACCGRISMAEYRRVVAEAADFAVGRRGGHIEQLRRRMREASESLLFERAAAYKARLERLSELEEPDFQHVAPLDEFRFVLVQPYTGRKAKVFFADCEKVTPAEVLTYPPDEGKLREMLDRAQQRMTSAACEDEPARWRMGLLCRYLFSSPRRKGLILRLRDNLEAAELAGAIRDSSDVLGLKPPPPKRDKGNTSHR